MNSGHTTWRDFTLLLVMAFFVFVVWMLPHLNPPASEDQSKPPGNVIVHVVWPNGSMDVDLWLWGPGEMRPVGYSNTSGQLWNLLRDDRGTISDLSGINYENAYTRGVVEGEYIINVNCYRCMINLPILVKVEVTAKLTPHSPPIHITYVEAYLRANKEEITMVRFKLDKKGKLVPGSMNHLFESLRDTSGDEGMF